jgi:hypothetical protein
MYLIGIIVISREQAEGRIGVFVNGGVEAGVDPTDEAGKIGAHADEELFVGGMAGEIPIVEADVLVVDVAVDFAFDEDQVIRLDGDVGAGESFHEAGHVAAGVDDPFDATSLEIADEGDELRRDGRFFELGEKGAVEVSGD